MRSLSDRLRQERQAEADDRPLDSRSDRRREEADRERALKQLARRLVALDRRHLPRLGLDEELFDAVVSAQAMRTTNAKNRQIGVVRQHLRGEVADQIELRLSRLLDGRLPRASEPSPLDERVASWRGRLVREGDEAVSELVERYCATDRRQELRQLARAASRAGQAKTSSARRQARLDVALKEILRAVADEESGSEP